MDTLCIICRERKATVPDRNQQGRYVNRVCGQCHAARLMEDMKFIFGSKLKTGEKNMPDQ